MSFILKERITKADRLNGCLSVCNIADASCRIFIAVLKYNFKSDADGIFYASRFSIVVFANKMMLLKCYRKEVDNSGKNSKDMSTFF